MEIGWKCRYCELVLSGPMVREGHEADMHGKKSNDVTIQLTGTTATGVAAKV